MNLNVGKISDYESLVQLFAGLQRLNPSLSLGQLAQLLEYKNRSAAHHVVKGRRNLSPQAALNLAHALKLKGADKKYFDQLCHVHRLKTAAVIDPTEMKDAQLKLLLAKSAANQMQEVGPFRPIRKKWLYNLIRELHHVKKPMNMSEYQFEAWLKRRIGPSVSLPEIRETLMLIKEKEPLRATIQGRQPVSTHIVSDSGGQPNPELRELQKQILSLAGQALDNTPLNERQFRGLTLAVGKDKISEMREKIAQFIDEMNFQYSEKSGDEVYHLQVSFFPMTSKGDSEN